MKRILAALSALLLSCCALAAQSPAADPAAPAPAAPGATSTESAEIAQFQKIEDTWSDAVNRRDQYGLELVMSPLFVDVSSTGNVTTRNQQVVQVITGPDKTVELSQKVVTVRLLGDVAIANGTYEMHHKASSGPVDERGVFTHVFERVRGGWLCINSQRTVLREDAGTKTRKQSTAAEPFHVPFFSKSDKTDNQ
jgi:ketosteroid isomerase-like protein